MNSGTFARFFRCILLARVPQNSAAVQYLVINLYRQPTKDYAHVVFLPELRLDPPTMTAIQ